MLDGGRLQIQQIHRRLHGLRHRGKKQQAQAPRARQRNNPQLRRPYPRQRAFAASQQMGQRPVRLAQTTVQAIAGPPLGQARRHAPPDFLLIFSQQFLELMAQGFQPVQAVRVGDAAVGHHHFQRKHVVPRAAIEWRMRSGGIVGDHAAEGGARAGGDIRTEPPAVRPQKVIQLIQYHPRSDAHGAPFQIQFADLAVMPGEINDQTVAQGAAGQTAARAPRNDRPSLRRGALDGFRRFAGRFGKSHPDWRDLV